METSKSIRNHILNNYISGDKYKWHLGFSNSNIDIVASLKTERNFRTWEINQCEDVQELIDSDNYIKDNSCNTNSKVVYIYQKEE
jgi:glutaredoxin-related protein